MGDKVFVSGDEAIAIGVKLCKPKVIAAYPITPQTIVVERLAEMVENKELNCKYIYVESEHSALSAVMAAAALGVRTFTATSSQGLLYMAEVLHYASGGRVPLVMMNANRSVALPWSIFGDQRDSLSLLDSGWIQVYVEDAQEALDTIIEAYKLAEDNRVLTPVMVNLDGFVLTHTYEGVDIPSQEEVDNFLPSFNFSHKMDFEKPKNIFFSSSPEHNIAFKYDQHLAMLQAKEVIKELDTEFENIFHRSYGGLLKGYLVEDAEIILITLGSITGTAREVVDELRETGKKVGIVKLRYMRPFPSEALLESLREAKIVGVFEKDISFGYEGTVFTNVASTLNCTDNSIKVFNFIGGLGGKNVSKNDIRNIFFKLIEVKNGGELQRVNFVNIGVEV